MYSTCYPTKEIRICNSMKSRKNVRPRFSNYVGCQHQTTDKPPQSDNSPI